MRLDQVAGLASRPHLTSPEQSARLRPGCTPTARQRASNEGCFGSTRVGLWLCHGLFPGEGYDLHCSSGERRIHAGAGG
jgi:hypothetical protein